jgi:N-acetylglucosamine-6-sulfatase
VPLLAGVATRWRTDFLVEHWQMVHQRGGDVVPPNCAVRNKQYSYTRYRTGEEQLYDLAADPYELNNVAGDPAHSAIRDALHERLVELCSPPPPGYSP